MRRNDVVSLCLFVQVPTPLSCGHPKTRTGSLNCLEFNAVGIWTYVLQLTVLGFVARWIGDGYFVKYHRDREEVRSADQ